MTTAYSTAVEMLALPRVSSLSRERRDGKVCVWCRGDAMLDLGPRIGVVHGELTRFFPRGCLPCARREAERVWGIHTRTCQRCTRVGYCPDGRALHKLATGGSS